MTKKDHKKLARVFNRSNSIMYIEGYKTGNGAPPEPMNLYYHILKRLIIMLKRDNPRFNADKFIRACDDG